jgi:hypothetical protein
MATKSRLIRVGVGCERAKPNDKIEDLYIESPPF